VHKKSYYIINGITLYRLVSAPVLLVLVFIGEVDIFKWLLAISFFTDAIDGFLARKFSAASRFGSRIDSIADDATVLAGVVGAFVIKNEFVRQEATLILILLAFYALQTVLALIRYGKISSFHTYLAKIGAVLQGSFLILLFFLSTPPCWLFYIASVVTIIDLIEETILIFLLPKWEVNVKGIYWVLRKKYKKVKGN
jgi:phosphatidylglycerophosphate synthase